MVRATLFEHLLLNRIQACTRNEHTVGISTASVSFTRVHFCFICVHVNSTDNPSVSLSVSVCPPPPWHRHTKSPGWKNHKSQATETSNHNLGDTVIHVFTAKPVTRGIPDNNLSDTQVQNHVTTEPSLRYTPAPTRHSHRDLSSQVSRQSHTPGVTPQIHTSHQPHARGAKGSTSRQACGTHRGDAAFRRSRHSHLHGSASRGSASGARLTPDWKSGFAVALPNELGPQTQPSREAK